VTEGGDDVLIVGDVDQVDDVGEARVEPALVELDYGKVGYTLRRVVDFARWRVLDVANPAGPRRRESVEVVLEAWGFGNVLLDVCNLLVILPVVWRRLVGLESGHVTLPNLKVRDSLGFGILEGAVTGNDDVLLERRGWYRYSASSLLANAT
jgi:hypothetical protein